MFDITRMSIGGLVVYPAGALFGPRTTGDFEFVWIVEGQVIWEENGNPHKVGPGDIILVQPNTRDSFIWDPKRSTKHAFIHFTIEDPDNYLPPLNRWPLIRSMPNHDVIRPLFRQYLWLRSRTPGTGDELSKHALKHMVMSFVTGALIGHEEESLEMPDPVERAIRFVQSSWDRSETMTPPDLKVMAKAAGVSDVHLCRLFRQSLGHGPVTIVRYLRLEHAAALLNRSNLQIQEVARLAGFENPFHFTRCFRDYYGCSPRTYRRQLKEGATLYPKEKIIASLAQTLQM